MSLALRWVGAEEMDRVAEARMLAYAPGRGELEKYRAEIRCEPRSGPGDWLLAERDGAVVGTATQLAMTMWVRGGSIPCQGVAYVGTAKTQRRRIGQETGVGTAVMNETIRMARERGFVVSALMPFRASYYEHFGYGIVERRRSWTIPLAIIPPGDFGGIRYYRENDFDALVACRQRVAQNGQADIERSAEFWKVYLAQTQKGFIIVDRDGDGPVRGWMTIEHQHEDGLDKVRAWWDFGYEDLSTLKRFIYFMGSLKDQYHFATVQLPEDLPLNVILGEKQMTHRVSRNHPNAEARPFTRMQVRVLDHKKFLEAMKLRPESRGKCVVSVREPEGESNKFAIEIGDGRISVAASGATADIECEAHHWAMIATGELEATLAAELGLIDGKSRASLEVLDLLAQGVKPYCREYF